MEYYQIVRCIYELIYISLLEALSNYKRNEKMKAQYVVTIRNCKADAKYV